MKAWLIVMALMVCAGCVSTRPMTSAVVPRETETVKVKGLGETVLYCVAARATPDNEEMFAYRLYCSHMAAFTPEDTLVFMVVDETLNVVGRIPVVRVGVTTKSGDVEDIVLRPHADSITRYTAVVPTERAAVRQGDHTIQTALDDVLYVEWDNIRVSLVTRD